MLSLAVLSACGLDGAGGPESPDPVDDSIAKPKPPDTVATVAGTPCASTSAGAPVVRLPGPVAFTFTAQPPPSTFRCGLDGAAPAACTTPTTVSGTEEGLHVFRVATVHPGGSIDPTPAECYFAIDSTGPAIEFSPGPSSCTTEAGEPTRSQSGTIGFALTDGSGSGVAAATCTLLLVTDGIEIVVASATDCATGEYPYTNLTNGRYVLRVDAVDSLGNASAGTTAFVVDASAPVVTFVSPAVPTPLTFGDPRSTIFADIVPNQFDNIGTFLVDTDASTAPVTFTCIIDGVASECDAGSYVVPAALAELAFGHVVSIAATDCIGNLSITPLTFYVDRSPPVLFRSNVVVNNGPASSSATVELNVTDTTNVETVDCVIDFDVNGENPDTDSNSVFTPCPTSAVLPTRPDGSVARPRALSTVIELFELAPGEHKIWIRTTDFWGHASLPTVIAFRVQRPVGHIALIGHDFDETNASTRTLVGNAARLSDSRGYNRSLQIVELDLGFATAASRANVHDAITNRLAEFGESADFYAITGFPVGLGDQIAARLLGRDVLLVHDQNNPVASAIIGGTPAWRSALRTFVESGGVVIVLDGVQAGPGSSLSETARILGGSVSDSLLDTVPVREIAGRVHASCCSYDALTEDVADLVEPDDGYAATTSSVVFLPESTADAVYSSTFELNDDPPTTATHPVVLHRQFPPLVPPPGAR